MPSRAHMLDLNQGVNLSFTKAGNEIRVQAPTSQLFKGYTQGRTGAPNHGHTHHATPGDGSSPALGTTVLQGLKLSEPAQTCHAYTGV